MTLTIKAAVKARPLPVVGPFSLVYAEMSVSTSSRISLMRVLSGCSRASLAVSLAREMGIWLRNSFSFGINGADSEN